MPSLRDESGSASDTDPWCLPAAGWVKDRTMFHVKQVEGWPAEAASQ